MSAGHLLQEGRREDAPPSDKWIDVVRKGLAIVSGGVCVSLLPFTMSRAGWMAAAVPALVWFLRDRRRVRMPLWGRCALAGVAAVILLVAAGSFKQWSALGRVHIWRMECRAVLHHPLGVGVGNELGAYGRMQHDYFASGERSPLEKRTAGCPEYAFNEYLKMGMQGGVPGLVLSLVIAVLATTGLMKSSPVAGYGMLSLAVFAFASFPLSLTAFRCILFPFLAMASVVPRGKERFRGVDMGLLVLVAIAFALTAGYRIRIHQAEGEVRMRRFSEMGYSFSGMSQQLAPYYPLMAFDYRYLYEYGHALYRDGRYGEGIGVLAEGSRISSDPMFYNVMGLCQQALREYEAAEASFQYAHLMVPGRIMPLYFQMKLSLETGDPEKAAALAEQILSIPANPNNTTMMTLRKEAEKFVLTDHF